MLLVILLQNFNFSENQSAGGSLCNVTARPYHVCEERWNATTTVGCENASMITTIATSGQYANWIEVASTDNCNLYVDSTGWWCETKANEPSNLGCTVHVWGSWWD
jgi:hypothetical protein